MGLRPFFTPVKCYKVFHSDLDPCQPVGVIFFSTPVSLYIRVQPQVLRQFPIREALRNGTLWPALTSPFEFE